MKKVTDAEFRLFVNNYPGELYQGFIKKAHPPRQEYNDFSIGNYPDSVVAALDMYHISEDIEDQNKPNEQFIRDITVEDSKFYLGVVKVKGTSPLKSEANIIDGVLLKVVAGRIVDEDGKKGPLLLFPSKVHTDFKYESISVVDVIILKEIKREQFES